MPHWILAGPPDAVVLHDFRVGGHTTVCGASSVCSDRFPFQCHETSYRTMPSPDMLRDILRPDSEGTAERRRQGIPNAEFKLDRQEQMLIRPNPLRGPLLILAVLLFCGI